MTDSVDPATPRYSPQTELIHGGIERSQHGETAEALYLTSGYVYDSAEQAAARMSGDEPGFVYSRYANPTVRMLEDRLALIEGAETCRIAASGMGAISSALMSPLQTGDRVVAASALFGSCRWIIGTLMPRFGIEIEFVQGDDLEAWAKALSRPAKLVLVESPANPMLDGVDISAVAELAHKAGAKLVVDNVFATPMLQKPLEFGADLIVYSATKHMDGQGRVLAGAILGKSDWIEEHVDPYLRHTGPAASPFNAWVVLKGLETLNLRVERASATAARLADAVAGHEKVRAVRYPGRKDHPHHEVLMRQMTGGGTLIALSLKGARAEAFRFLNALNLIHISNNLGDSKSLACHPASTTHRALSDEERAAMGLDDSWVRLSIGLEDAGDLERDLHNALDAI
ncbi:MAG: O-succinylhomoserine sulfhydrylase [Hyphomonadaceae bacterium]|nr:O-succinylhomoserine sulfhydrylase [Hyphomonadaceae bacterium]